MKKIMHIFLFALLSVTTLTACSSSLDPDTFTAEVSVQDDSNWWSGYRTVAVLSIRSNVEEEVQVNDVRVNNGQCSYEDVTFPRYFKMGQMLNLKLKCGMNNVVRVDIETTQGNLKYQF